MVNVLLPLTLYMLDLGISINLRNYGVGDHFLLPIHDDKHFLQKDIKAYNASYYVLPDETIPYSKLYAPLDLVLSTKVGVYNPYYPSILLDTHEILQANGFGGATILVVAEYRTIEYSLKENADPELNWQESFAEKRTHYADQLIFGGRLASLIKIKAMEQGDVQVLRRLLKEAFGTSGTIGDDTADLWNNAFHAIQKHPDVRGMVHVEIKNVMLGVSTVPGDIDYDAKSVFDLARDLPKHVHFPTANESPGKPILIHFKPLSDIDERYISLEKNVEGEIYMKKMDTIEKDVAQAFTNMGASHLDITGENEKQMEEIVEHVVSLYSNIHDVLSGNISLYTDIDLAGFQRVFDKYQEGLKDNYSSYVETFQRLQEIGNRHCGKRFLKPTRGFLNLGKHQGVVQHDDVNLKDCQDACSEDENCRSVAYTETERKCWVYPRSTVTATIVLPEEWDLDMKIYDRDCS